MIPSTGKTNFSSVEKKKKKQLENVSAEGTWTSNVALKLGLDVSLPTSYSGGFHTVQISIKGFQQAKHDGAYIPLQHWKLRQEDQKFQASPHNLADVVLKYM